MFCLLEHKEYRNIAKMNETPVWEENTQDDVIKAYMKKVDALTDMVNTLQKEVASLNEQINPPVPKGEKVTTSDGKYLVTDKQCCNKINRDYSDFVNKDVVLTNGMGTDAQDLANHDHDITKYGSIEKFTSFYIKPSSKSPVTFPKTVTMTGFEIFTYGETW